GVNSPVRAFRAVGGTPFFVARAKGARLIDVDGQSYVDYVCSWGPLILGHAHPAVLAAIREAAERGWSYGAPCEPEVELAELVRRAGRADRAGDRRAVRRQRGVHSPGAWLPRRAPPAVRSARRVADLRRGDAGVPRRGRRSAGAARRPRRSHHARQDHRRGAAGGGVRWAGRVDAPRGARGPGLPGRDAVRESGGHGGGARHAAGDRAPRFLRDTRAANRPAGGGYSGRRAAARGPRHHGTCGLDVGAVLRARSRAEFLPGEGLGHRAVRALAPGRARARRLPRPLGVRGGLRLERAHRW